MRTLQPPIPGHSPNNPTDTSAAQSSLRRLQQAQASGSQQKKDDVGVKTGEAAAASTSQKGKPRLLLMGQRRSGKSSISSVVFHKLPPNETLFLESTARIQKDSMA